jgi:uncharacterized DUF497 family protein
VIEWDEREAAANLRKHGVSFDEAATVFADSEALDDPDVMHSAREERFLRLGRSLAGRVLMVAYTFRGPEMSKRSASSARGTQAAKKERRTAATRRINFSDIPEASAEQLRGMRRVGRPSLGKSARQLIAIRLDPDVLKRFRVEAKRQNVGYQTLNNRVLAKHVGKDVA